MMIFITPTTSPQSRSYDLRFYPISWAPKNVDNLLTLMGDRNRWFGNLPIWKSDLQMGGEKDWIPSLLADGFGYVYKVLDPIPSWILMMVSVFRKKKEIEDEKIEPAKESFFARQPFFLASFFLTGFLLTSFLQTPSFVSTLYFKPALYSRDDGLDWIPSFPRFQRQGPEGKEERRKEG